MKHTRTNMYKVREKIKTIVSIAIFFISFFIEHSKLK